MKTMNRGHWQRGTTSTNRAMSNNFGLNKVSEHNHLDTGNKDKTFSEDAVPLEAVHIYFATETYDEYDRDVKVEL